MSHLEAANKSCVWARQPITTSAPAGTNLSDTYLLGKAPQYLSNKLTEFSTAVLKPAI